MSFRLRRGRARQLSKTELESISIPKLHDRSPAPPLGTVLLLLMAFINARAGDDIRTTGDLLQFVLPATAAGLTLGYRDWEGSLEFAESAGLTLAATYAL